MAEHEPQNTIQDDELSFEELESAAGGGGLEGNQPNEPTINTNGCEGGNCNC